jgi:hypothetical protein
MLDADWPMILLGGFGGAIPDILRIIKGRYGSMPGYLKTGYFWIGFLLLVALGGLAAWLSKAQEVQEALAYGFGAPELISRLLSQSEQNKGKDGQTFELLRQWWTY